MTHQKVLLGSLRNVEPTSEQTPNNPNLRTKAKQHATSHFTRVIFVCECSSPYEQSLVLVFSY